MAELMALLDLDADGCITEEELCRALPQHAGSLSSLLETMALRPPAIGEKLFFDLEHPQGPVHIPLTEERAITLGQLKRVAAHIKRRCGPEQWLGKRPVDGTWQHKLLNFRDVNLYDCAAHVILPATHNAELSAWSTETREVWGTKPSMVEMMASERQPPDYFTSQ